MFKYFVALLIKKFKNVYLNQIAVYFVLLLTQAYKNNAVTKQNGFCNLKNIMSLKNNFIFTEVIFKKCSA